MKLLKLLYHTLFYRIHRFASPLRTDYEATWAASTVIGFLIGCDFLFFLKVVDYERGAKFDFIMAIMLGSTILNLLYFLRQDRYKSIIEDQKKRGRNWGPTIVALVFIFLSVFSMFLLNE